MTADRKFTSSAPSRRRLLKGGACAGAAAILGVAAPGAAAAFGPASGQSWAEWAQANTPRKSTQRDADYQPAAFGHKRCSTCLNFIPPNRCAVVEELNGTDGLCRLYYGSRR